MIKGSHYFAILIFLFTLNMADLSESGQDHDSAKNLKEAGKILSLEQILEKTGESYPGRFLEAELEKTNGMLIYEIEILDKEGKVWELKYDAKTGELLEKEKED